MESLTKPKAERIAGLDLLKALAILLVVFVHDNDSFIDFLAKPDVLTFSNYGLYALIVLCVPILFFVNGALIMNKPFDAKQFFRKTMKVALLTVIWGVLTLAVLMLLHGDTFSIGTFLRDLWYWKQDYINHLWFFQTLVMIYLFLIVIIPAWQARTDGFRIFFLCLLVLTAGNALMLASANVIQSLFHIDVIQGQFNFFNDFNPFIGNFGYSFAYVLLGGWMFANRERFNTKRGRGIALAVFLATMLLLVGYGILLSYSKGTRYLFGTVDYGSIFAFVATASLFVLSLGYSGNGFFGRLVTLVGRNTIAVYFMHRIMSFLIWRFLYGISHLVVFSLAVSAVTVLICALAGEGLRRIPGIRWLFSI
jgi:surface polysaccharide O-acyltransferase-like enzyme